MHRIVYYYGAGYKYKAHIESSEAALEYILSFDSKPIGFAMTQRRVEDSPSSYAYYMLDGKSLTAMNKADFFEYMTL